MVEIETQLTNKIILMVYSINHFKVLEKKIQILENVTLLTTKDILDYKQGMK